MAGGILVPLDGSELSESVLPLARMLAARMGLGVTLLGVVEPQRTATRTGEAAGEYQRALDETRDWLEAAGRRLRDAGLSVVTELSAGPADEEIDNTAVETGAWLVMIATHGRSGLGRWLRGSVADKVIRRGSVPVLAFKPGDRPVPASIERIVMPYDGSELAAAAAEPAVALASAFEADLDVVWVVPWAAATVRGEVGFVSEELDREIEADALARIEELREKLGYEKAHGVVLRGDPAREIENYARQLNASLIVMTTHGRSGFVRFALGSVADRVLASGAAPVLLVRPQESGAPATRRRRCFSCGRLAPIREIAPTDQCLRCKRHLHVCDNCVFFTGSVCLRGREEVAASPRGQTCPEFLFRETVAPKPGAL